MITFYCMDKRNGKQFQRSYKDIPKAQAFRNRCSHGNVDIWKVKVTTKEEKQALGL